MHCFYGGWSLLNEVLLVFWKIALQSEWYVLRGLMGYYSHYSTVSMRGSKCHDAWCHVLPLHPRCPLITFCVTIGAEEIESLIQHVLGFLPLDDVAHVQPLQFGSFSHFFPNKTKLRLTEANVEYSRVLRLPHFCHEDTLVVCMLLPSKSLLTSGHPVNSWRLKMDWVDFH